MKELDLFYFKLSEPHRSCLLFLRLHILNYDSNITEAWKYRMPFFCYKGKMFCYLWTHKKNGMPYIGIVEGRKLDHPDLIQETRARMKILFIDPVNDLPMDKIDGILNMALELYK